MSPRVLPLSSTRPARRITSCTASSTATIRTGRLGMHNGCSTSPSCRRYWERPRCEASSSGCWSRSTRSTPPPARKCHGRSSTRNGSSSTSALQASSTRTARQPGETELLDALRAGHGVAVCVERFFQRREDGPLGLMELAANDREHCPNEQVVRLQRCSRPRRPWHGRIFERVPDLERGSVNRERVFDSDLAHSLPVLSKVI